METVVFVPPCNELEDAADAATVMIVDAAASETLSTRTLNALLAARSRLLAHGGLMAVVASPRNRRRFGLLGLDRRFVLAANRRQALELLGVADSRRLATSPFDQHRARAA
jgi:anti-anti-sigma regulatory factor